MKYILSCATVVAVLVTSSSCAPVNQTLQMIGSTHKAPLPHLSIIYPHKGSWFAGEHHNVTWNTTHLPKGMHWPNTAITIGRDGAPMDADVLGGDRQPLVQNFSLYDGSAQVTIPAFYDGVYTIGLWCDHGSSRDKGAWSSPMGIYYRVD